VDLDTWVMVMCYVIAIVYVDNALFFGPDKAFVNQMKAKFMKLWDCRDLGKPNEFIGIHIRQIGQCIKIDQCAVMQVSRYHA
jgi:hypothetical protein